MVKCSVFNCAIATGERSLFSLPKNDESRVKWLNFLISSGKEVHENVFYRICENHFLPTDFINCEKIKRLKPGSVPSILLPEHKLEVK